MEVWEDLVSIKDLVISLIICLVTTLGLYFISAKQWFNPVIFWVVWSVLGFGICSFLFKPKRNFIKDEEGK